MGGGAVDTGFAQRKAPCGTVQIQAAEGIGPFALEGHLQPVGIVRKVKVAQMGAMDALHGVFAVQDEDGLQRAFSQQVHLVEGVVLLQQLRLFQDQVNDHTGRSILRRHGHAAYAQIRIPGLEAGSAFPRALPGRDIAGGGVGAGGRERENQAAAAVHPVS